MNFITTNHQLALFFFSFLFSLFSQTAHNQINRISIPVRQLIRFSQPVPVSIHSLARDSTGIIYIGTNSSLLQYNGELKTCARIPGQVLVTRTEDGRMLAAGMNSFGFVLPDEYGKIRYKPLESVLPESAGQAKQLISTGKLVLIRFEHATYIYSGTGLQMVGAGDTIISLVKTHDGQVLAFGTKDIYQLHKDRFNTLPVPDQFSAGTPELVVTLDTCTMFRFGGGRWLTFRNGVLSIPDIHLDNCWNTLINVYRTKDHEYLGENASGCFYLFDRQLLLLGEVEIQGGSVSGEKFNLQPVMEGEVMLVGITGLWKPIRMQGLQVYPLAGYGIESGVVSLTKLGNELFAIAGGELYSCRQTAVNGVPGLETPFRRVEGSFGKVLAFGVSKGSGVLYVATSEGIWVQAEGKFLQIIRNRNFREVVFIRCPEEILALEGENLIGIRIKGNPGGNMIPRTDERIIAGNMGEVLSAGASLNGEILLRSADESLFRLSSGGELQQVSYLSAGSQPGWFRFANINGSSVILSSSGAYVPVERSKLFGSFPEEKKFTVEKGSWIYPLVEEKYSGNLFMAVRYPGCIASRILLVQPNGSSRQFMFPVNDDSEITALYADSSGFNLIASQNFLYCLDTRNEQQVSMQQRTIISSLVLGQDSVVPDGWLGNGHTLRLSSSENTFTIRLANTGFEEQGNTCYKVQLEGMDREYSSWSTKNEYTYAGLNPGRYTFRVISRTVSSEETSEFVYNLNISRPFYQSWYAIVFYLLAILGFIILYLRWRSWRFMQEKIHLEDLISKRTEELTKERDKSEQLIANILPKDTADELKKKGKASSQKYELVTVLFSDIQGFTHIAEQMNPETLIDQLDTFYYQFDSVAEKYNIEKIKTIGDAYMCAGGIPDKNRTNPVEVVLAGLEMQQFMKDLKATNANIWDLRIGVHTGPVIAGVVGHKKFSYDIWGDTVNVASRMESSGEAGKVNISGHTYDLVREFFICEYRGKMPVKYKGEVDMYFVKGIRPELSMNLKGLPNRHFFIQLQNLRLMDLEEYIVEQIGKSLDGKLHFHNLKYTIDVYTQCELLGRAEGLSGEELLLLRTAGLLQGMGYVLDYADPAGRSAAYAAEILPSFKYDQGQIEIVSRILGSAKNEPEQLGQLERIFSDACLNYLGRPDYPELAVELLLEINEHGKQHSAEDWIHRQEKFLQQHQFFTTAARRLREYDMSTQLKALKVRLSTGNRQG